MEISELIFLAVANAIVATIAHAAILQSSENMIDG